jgi:hypothetical protein
VVVADEIYYFRVSYKDRKNNGNILSSGGVYVVLARTDVSEERSAFIIRVTRIDKPGTLEVTSNGNTLRRVMMEALCSSDTLGLTTATRSNIPENDILHSHRRENFKCYIALIGCAL